MKKFLSATLLTALSTFCYSQELVKDINPTPYSQVRSDEYQQMCVRCGNFIYFFGRDAAHGLEVWRTDSTPEGTKILADIQPGPDDGVYSQTPLKCAFGRIYFNSVNGLLSSSGGNPTLTSTMGENIEPFIDNQIIFNQGNSVVVSNIFGSESLVKLFIPMDGAYIDGMVIKVSGSNAFIRFGQFDSANGELIQSELWVTDGTTTIQLVTTSEPIIRDMYAFDNGKIGLSWHDPTHGEEAWISDGTVAGTRMLVDANPGTGNSNAMFVGEVDGRLFFGTQIRRISFGFPTEHRKELRIPSAIFFHGPG